MQRQVCKFFQTGNCKFGNSCKFLHVRADGDACDAQTAGTVADFVNKAPDTLANTIRKDLAGLKSIQINPALTAYGLGPHAINNLIEGRDVSPEELRLQYMEAATSNTLDQYNRNVELRQRDMEYCISEVTNNARIAARYQQQGVSNRSNIRPFVKKSLEESIRDLQNTPSTSNAFGSSGFGQNSGSNPFAQSNPFGSNNTGSFGSTGFSNNNTGGAFGQKTSNSAFGTSSFGSGGAFGNTVPAAGSTGFGSAGFGSAGNSGAFGGSTSSGAFGSSGFGQTSVTPTANTGAFGSSSLAFGQPSATSNQPASAFGSSNPTSSGGSGFGSAGFGSSSAAPSTSGAFGSAGFGSSGFGGSAPGSSGFQGTHGNTTANPFGQSTPSAFGTAPASSGFGNTSNNTSTFGTGSASFGNTSNQPSSASAFGQPSNNTSAFRGFSQNSTSNSGFGTTNTATMGSMQSAIDTKPASSDALEGFDPEVRKAFLAAAFELGKIPDIPPPPEIC